jgi:hypothetical protein
MKQHPGSVVVPVVVGHAQSSCSALAIQWHAARSLQDWPSSICPHIVVL